MKKISTILFGTIFATIILVSCESKTYDEVTLETDNPTYLANIKPIMTTNCTNCHSAESGQEPYLETYDQVKESIINGTLIQEIEAPTGQGMPESGRMQQSRIDLINLWVANGFPN